MTDDHKVLVDVILSEIEMAQKYNVLVHDLQSEINRLRLTDAERGAIRHAIDALSGVEDLNPTASTVDSVAVETLRGILERLP